MTKERAISEVMQIYGYLSPDKQQALDVLIQATKDLDKMQSVLNEIRAEIEEVVNENEAIDSNNSRAQNIGLMWVLQIIDKYRGEL